MNKFYSKKENKDIANKMMSNVPVVDYDSYGRYADILDAKVKDKNITNIGIIASYGAGKSSLIATYKDKYFKSLIPFINKLKRRAFLREIKTFEDATILRKNISLK